MIDTVSMVSFAVEGDSCVNFLPKIIDVKFVNLQILCFSGEKATSIELLQRVELPTLEKLVFDKTRVNNLNSLVKVNLKRIDKLSINDEANVELKELYRCNCLKLFFEYSKNKSDEIKRFANKPKYANV